jgi:hypothetical protein
MSFGLSKDRMIALFMDFSAKQLPQKAITEQRVRQDVEGFTDWGQPLTPDPSRQNSDDFFVGVAMHVLSALIAHGILYVGKKGWEAFFAKPPEEIRKEVANRTPFPALDTAEKQEVLPKAAEHLRKKGYDATAEGWQGERKKED